MSHSPTLQETLTHDLCDLLYNRLGSEGAAVYIEGLHLCMAARGATAHEARVVTSAVQGVFLDNLATRNEFIKLVTWIDANAPYYATYSGRRNLKYKDHPDFRPAPTAGGE